MGGFAWSTALIRLCLLRTGRCATGVQMANRQLLQWQQPCRLRTTCTRESDVTSTPRACRARPPAPADRAVCRAGSATCCASTVTSQPKAFPPFRCARLAAVRGGCARPAWRAQEHRRDRPGWAQRADRERDHPGICTRSRSGAA